MTESDEANRDDEVDERLGEATTYSQGLNLNSRSTPIHITGLYPFCQSNSSTQLQQESPQFDNNQAYPNMTFFQQPFPMPPYTNMFYQQPVQPSQHHTTQPQVDVNAFQHTTPPPPPPPPPPPSLKASRRNKKNCTNEEDIQLTISWLRITTDPAVGVGQKNDTLWERVLKLFIKLMHEHHKMKPEDNVRTTHAVENRMSEIKSQCSKWTAIRARVLSSYKSGWSPEDIENLCLERYKVEAKKTFKVKECWEILKANPKWHDYINTKASNNSQSIVGTTRAKRQRPSSEPQMDESLPNDTSDTMETQTPHSPTAASVCSEAEVRGNGRVDCTPNLDGPASIEIQHPPGMAISKPKNQRQRRLKQHSESVALESQSIIDSLASLESASTYQWEKLLEENRKRDLVDNARYDDMKRKYDLEHVLKVGNELSDSVIKRGEISEKLFAAIQLLDQMDPRSLATNNQRMLYELRKNAVKDFQDRYEALGVLISHSKANSPPSVVPNKNVENARTSERPLFDEDEVHLRQDSQR